MSNNSEGRAEYLRQLGVKLGVQFVPQSISRNRDSKEKSLNWVCAIELPGKAAYRVEFMQGIGHIPGYSHNTRETFWDRKHRLKLEEACETGRYPRQAEVFLPLVPLPEPRLDDVLSSLLSDAQIGGLSFEEFCSEMGYDEDSRKAEEIWRACQKTARAIARLFTPAQRQKLEEMYSDY